MNPSDPYYSARIAACASGTLTAQIYKFSRKPGLPVADHEEGDRGYKSRDGGRDRPDSCPIQWVAQFRVRFEVSFPMLCQPGIDHRAALRERRLDQPGAFQFRHGGGKRGLIHAGMKVIPFQRDVPQGFLLVD